MPAPVPLTLPAETEEPSASRPGHGISFGAAVRAWTRVSIQSFGGPAGQIAVMHRVLVEEKRWVSEARFLHALNYVMLLPGPEAQQLATYIGWLLHGLRGGLVAGLLFVLPGFVSILILSLLYAQFRDVGIVAALFYGVKPAVVAIVVEAVFRIGRRALKNRTMLALAAAAFVGIFFLQLPFPLIVLGAGAIGLLGGRVRPAAFPVVGADATEGDGPGAGGPALSDHAPVRRPPSWRGTVAVAAVWLVIWWAPVAVLAAVLGLSHIFVREAVFFSKVAVVTFGGAYAVLSYVAQEAVETYGWLRPGEMLDGLGMAETTPGPLIQVVQFVGFMGAFRDPGGLSPVTAGVLGSVLTTWVVYAPCFLYTFTGAPWIEHLRGNRALSTALSAITAAVVGVILNLAVWFSVHVLFGRVDERHLGPVRVLVPDAGSLDPGSLVITIAAFAALFGLKLGMLRTLAGAAVLGMLYHLVAGA